MHLRNAPTELMEELGYGAGYIYPQLPKALPPAAVLTHDIEGQTFWHPPITHKRTKTAAGIPSVAKETAAKTRNQGIANDEEGEKKAEKYPSTKYCRLFGNTNSTRKPNGTLEENGSGQLDNFTRERY